MHEKSGLVEETHRVATEKRIRKTWNNFVYKNGHIAYAYDRLKFCGELNLAILPKVNVEPMDLINQPVRSREENYIKFVLGDIVIYGDIISRKIVGYYGKYSAIVDEVTYNRSLSQLNTQGNRHEAD